MTLRDSNTILQMWRYAFRRGARIVLMRHGPKSGSDKSNLSAEGRNLAAAYGTMLRPIWSRFLKGGVLACTAKARTMETLAFLFPASRARAYLRLSDLDAPRIPPALQARVEECHRRVGRFRGYFLNHTYYYYFLKERGGACGGECLPAEVVPRMVRGIAVLASLTRPVIYCGHSPAIEAACERLLGMEIAELGGFLNPLDSLHLRLVEGRFECIARVNPLIGYRDLESETYLRTT